VSDLYPADPANPIVALDRMHAILAEHWGLDGELTALGSMQDQNFRVRARSGEAAVAKIAGLHTSRQVIDLQNAAMDRVAERGAQLSSPRPIPTTTGQETVVVDGHQVRLLTWVEGIPLADRAYIGRADLFHLGALAARVARALEGFQHPGLELTNTWDVRHAGRVLAECLAILPGEWTHPLQRALAAFDLVGPDASLPVAVVHGDLTPVNAVCLPGDELVSRPVGVLDFGDVMRTWRIGDVAASAVGAVEHPATSDPLDAALAVLQGYHATCPLTEAELAAFWPLVVARSAVSAAISQRQFDRNLNNGYAERGARFGLRAIRRLAAVPPALAHAAVRESVGLEPVPGSGAVRQWLTDSDPAELVPGLQTAPVAIVDLSAESPDHACGEWANSDVLRDQISASPISIGRWAEPRIVGNIAPRPEAGPTLHLGADLFVADATPVAAPLAGTVRAVDHDGAAAGVVIDLHHPQTPLLLRLSHLVPSEHLSPGARVDAGEQVGSIAPATGLLPPHVHVQLLLADGLPEDGHAAHGGAWRALCPDPSPLLPVAAAAHTTSAADLRRDREAVVAQPQHLYYDQPPAIVRGWRHHLYDQDGRCYLDMINNIAAVGHSHPGVTDAAVRQFRRLNTNSRFLYDVMTRYSERIAQLLPGELSRVFLVNSGSEAADLALQLAKRFTGRQDVVALAGAYHGWTGSVIDISTSPMDRPNWRAELPPWVHIAEQPDTYRGVHAADAEAYRSSVRAACAASADGPAAFICEPLLGNQGALELPAGYLRAVYADVRAAGGLCIADEVQVGMARTGDTFWAFEHEDVVPDIVFTAKATGNGHPLGVVACRPEIAAAFDGQTAYFSSTGGGPVSCAIGLAVLDIIRDEGLQQNAKVQGAYLRQRLLELSERHPLIGAVHGRGLYQGVDLVLDRERRTPATFEALAISERLRALGVIMQPTGDAFNVLKVKPPMCIDRLSADYFIDMLDAVLTELV
jgi:4-aminobutyrate aminotransferase-like enzyme/Ser/Thr protein kinase RdoA (MazF antagonist)